MHDSSTRLVLCLLFSLSACDGASVTGDDGGMDGASPVECSPNGTVVGDACVCEPGYAGPACRECQPGYEEMGDACVALATSWEPWAADENFDRETGRITGLPAVVSYAEPGDYPEHVGTIRHSDTPVGRCEIIEDALMGVAPAMRCEFTATYEDSADPSIGGDPHGYGQTYLGPGGMVFDEAIGDITALSISFVWQFGSGWVEAMQQRDTRRFETPWSGEHAGIEVGGAGGKPLITHRERCEYWYDVVADLGAAPAGRMSGALEAPDGLSTDSLEIEIGGAFLRSEGGELYDGGTSVGTIAVDGSYDFALPAGASAGAPVTAFYRTEPPGGDPANPRLQRDGAWRRPLGSDGCRERPMMLSRPIAVRSGEPEARPAMSLTMGDDISCYCWDWDGTTCHESADGDRWVQFRVGSPEDDVPSEGVYHVGVAEPMYVEMLLDMTHDVLELRVTTPDGRFDDTVVSRSSFCDSPDNGATRQNPNPHRLGFFRNLGEPFWALPLTVIPPNTWHQVGQWRITGATDGAALARQGPPPGFVR